MDPRDFDLPAALFTEFYAECPVVAGVMRKEWCPERCPTLEPDDRCPRRAEDASWWHGDRKVVEADIPQEGAITEAVDPVTPTDEPACSPTPTSPRRRGRRRGRRRDDARPDITEILDVFDLFG